MMEQEGTLTRAHFRTPRVAGVVGSVGSALLIIHLVLLSVSVPVELRAAGTWLPRNWKAIVPPLNLPPLPPVVVPAR